MFKKTLSFALAALLVIFSAALPALAETAPQPEASGKTITVRGNATITLKGDYGNISLGVTTKGSTVAAAQSANNEAMAKVIAAILEQGVANDDVVTSSFNVYPTYDYQYNKLSEDQTISGYQVDNMLSVTVRNLDSISKVLDAAMAAGANQSYGITFSSSKQAEAYDQALEDALKDGARKAGILAAGMDKSLGELISMEESDAGYSQYVGTSSLKSEDASAGTPILAGQIQVNATVTLTFSFK